MSRVRQRVGVEVARLMAVHRLSRMCFVGVSRPVMLRMLARARDGEGGGPPRASLPVHAFFSHQAFGYQPASDPRVAVRIAAGGPRAGGG